MSKTITYRDTIINEPAPADDSSRKFVINYLKLRRYIGYLGIGLPFVLAIGVTIFDQNEDVIQNSISSYYYTDMGDVFVGILVAIGVFLHSYKGHERIDNILTSLAGLFAIMTALIPTTSTDSLQETLHLGSATAFFIILAYFSYFLFTKSNKDNPGRQKIKRNRVYRICAVIMIISIASIPLFSSLLGKLYNDLNLTFWFEAIALWAFGFSWLTKGEALLADNKL